LRREREIGAGGGFAEQVVEGFLGGSIAFGLWRGRGSGDIVERGEKKIAEAGVGTAGEAPGVAKFLAELAAMVVFDGGVSEREGAAVLRYGGGIIFVEFGEFAEFFGRSGIWEESVTGFGVFAGGGVVVESGFDAGAEKEERGFVTLLFGSPFFR